MNISELALKRPILATVMNLLIILFGVVGYNFLSVREYPAIDPPVVNVRTSYAGANADIIESQITEPLEKSINGIPGIKTINSSSNNGSSNISIEFEVDQDLEAAANDVRDKVSQATRNLPQDIDAPPVVSKADANGEAIISMTVQSDSRSALELSDYAENVIGQRLETIPGVSGIQIWGQKRYAMRLWIDPVKLASYGCTVSEVREALNKQNVELPSGKITGTNTELTVKTVGNLATAEEFNNIIIRSEGEKIVRFSDVGTAIMGAENIETKMTQSGTPLVGVAIVPLPGANYLDISKEFYKEYQILKKDLPKDIHLNIVIDILSSDIILKVPVRNTSA